MEQKIGAVSKFQLKINQKMLYLEMFRLRLVMNTLSQPSRLSLRPLCMMAS